MVIHKMKEIKQGAVIEQESLFRYSGKRFSEDEVLR